jgi:GntR family transcriptional regulator / MocR family aminotransferase
MAHEWSNSGPEVLVQLDRESAVPLRIQLESQLRVAIQAGRLTSGERLPSSRTLAVEVGLSRGLVQECFYQLQAEGYLTARGGSTTRVADIPAIHPRTTDAPAPPDAPTHRLLADFQSGVPDLGLAPREDWAWAVREACRTAPDLAFDYGDPRGIQELRASLAGYLRRVRAADVHATELVICGGFAQGIVLALRTLAGRGLARVAFEDPGSVRTITRAAHAAGSESIAIPVDDLGLNVDALRSSPARVVVLTPAHQWPTGVVLAGERRHQLIAWARETDSFIIEDDYDAEFRYDREPVGSMQGLAPDRIISLGTVSKSLAPAIRLGWAALPASLAADFLAVKTAADRGSPGLDQLALSILIESGRYDRHLRRMRAEYSKRRMALVESLGIAAPHLRITGLAAGFHAVAHLANGADELQIIAEARTRGVGLHGMSALRSTQSLHPAQLVFGFGNTSQEEIRLGIAAVADLLS